MSETLTEVDLSEYGGLKYREEIFMSALMGHNYLKGLTTTEIRSSDAKAEGSATKGTRIPILSGSFVL